MSAYVLCGGAFKAKRVQDGIIDSFAHLPAMHGRRSERCFCRYFENITQRYFLHNKKQPCIRKTIPKTPAKIRGAIISILPVSLYRFKDVLFNYIAYRINRRFVKFFLEKIWDKRVQNGTCDSFAHLPAMRGRRFARCFCRYSGNIANDISYIIKKIPGPLCRGRGKNR